MSDAPPSPTGPSRAQLRKTLLQTLPDAVLNGTLADRPARLDAIKVMFSAAADQPPATSAELAAERRRRARPAIREASRNNRLAYQRRAAAAAGQPIPEEN